MESIKTGQPKGYGLAGTNKPKSEAEALNEELTRKLTDAAAENTALTDKIRMLELRVAELEGRPRSRQALSEAKMVDALVNGSLSGKEDK